MYLSAPPTCQIILAPVRSRLTFNCKHKVHTLKEWQVSGAPPCHVHMSVSRIRRTPHRLQRLCLGRMKPCVESIGDSFFLTHTHTHSFMRAPQVQWCGPVCGISWYALALSSGNPSNLLTGHRDRDTHTQLAAAVCFGLHLTPSFWLQDHLSCGERDGASRLCPLLSLTAAPLP